MHRRLVFCSVLVVVGVVFVGCSNGAGIPGAGPDASTPEPPAATTPPTVPPPLPAGDAGPDASRRSSCLDRPGSSRPSDRLPCELVPPGMTL